MGEYRKAKVYSDGAHYIAIPKKQYAEETMFTWDYVPDYVLDEDFGSGTFWKGDKGITEPPSGGISAPELMFCEQMEIDFGNRKDDTYEDFDDIFEENAEEKREKKMTVKDIFNELYKNTKGMTKSQEREFMRDNLLPFFRDEETCKSFISAQYERKHRNMIYRRIRMARKANLQEWNYFCTFTYSDELHKEKTFRKKLRNCLSLLSSRKGWKYIGVWERAPESGRLHFHGLFGIPEDTMPGILTEVTDYNTRAHRKQTTVQNTYFNERFGRSDFKAVDTNAVLDDSLRYIMKYIEKSGERIVYSKGLPQFYVLDINEEDVVCRTGIEDKKLLLFDDFVVYKDCAPIGKANKETLAQMPTEN